MPGAKVPAWGVAAVPRIKQYDPQHPKVNNGRLSESQWEACEPLLRQLHDEGVPRHIMAQRLRDEHNFAQNPGQLDGRFKKWGLSVYKTGASSITEETNTQILASGPDEQPSSMNDTSSLDGLPTDPDDTRSLEGACLSSNSSMELDEASVILETCQSFEGMSAISDIASLGSTHPLGFYKQVSPIPIPQEAVTSHHNGQLPAVMDTMEYRQVPQAMFIDEPAMQDSKLSDQSHSITSDSIESTPVVESLTYQPEPLPHLMLLELKSAIGDLTGTNASLLTSVLDDVASMTFASRLFSVSFDLFQMRYQRLQAASRDMSMVGHETTLTMLSCVGSAISQEQLRWAEMERSEITPTITLSDRMVSCNERNKAILAVLHDRSGRNRTTESVPESPFLALVADLPPAAFMKHYFIQLCQEIPCHGHWPFQCTCKALMNSHADLVRSIAQDWGVTLRDESSAIWSVLRECQTALEDFDLNELVYKRMGHGATRDELLSTFSVILGCHVVRKYVAQICDGTISTGKPVLRRERAFKLAVFRFKIQIIFTFTFWIVTKGPMPDFDTSNSEECILLEKAKIRAILKSPVWILAVQFEEYHKDLFKVSLETRQAMDGMICNIPYVMETALLLAQASVKLRSQMQDTWVDPVVGNRMSVDTQSIKSRASSGKSFLLYAQQLAAKRGSKASLQTMSSGLRSVFSRRSWEFDAVAGYPSSLSSIRASIAESMGIDT